MKHVAHVAVMQRKYLQNKADILEAIGLSEEAYHVLQFNTAIAWIRKEIWNDEDVVSYVTNQPLFWAWWVNQWNMREDAFLSDHLLLHLFAGVSTILNRADLRLEWELLHHLNNINIKASPLWATKAFENFVNNLIKHQHGNTNQPTA